MESTAANDGLILSVCIPLDKPCPEWENQGMNGRRNTSRMAAAVGVALSFIASAHACELKITWKAGLVPSFKGGPPTPSPVTGMGTVAIDFDLAHPGATVQVSTRNIQDVQAIEMHVARSYTDHSGPAVLTLYSVVDGPLPAALTKHVGEADLHRQTTPKITAFTDVVNAVLNGQAYVTVVTKAHPSGELSGFIRMHKEQIYSDSAADSTHDAALHHAAQAHTTASSPTP